MIFGQKATFLNLNAKQILHKHCFQFLLGPFSNSQGNAYAKCWGDKQRALWYIMVFSSVVASWFVSFHNCILIFSGRHDLPSDARAD